MDREVSLELVGGTVDRCTRALLERERIDLDVVLAPGNPLVAYQRAEVSVLPSLEDGSPFAAAEAMSCGLPLVITDSCGAAEWVDDDRTGWIVASRSVDALENALRTAVRRRPDLEAMGDAARAATVRRADSRACNAALRDWVLAG
jgi:glycosyltransferase involved in cell wall biosynthesis